MGGFDNSNTMCFNYRESNKCSSDKCKQSGFKHTGRSGNKCSDESYLKTGLCSKFRECSDSHPWDYAKFGSLEDLKANLEGANGNGPQRARKRAVEAAIGKSFSAQMPCNWMQTPQLQQVNIHADIDEGDTDFDLTSSSDSDQEDLLTEFLPMMMEELEEGAPAEGCYHASGAQHQPSNTTAAEGEWLGKLVKRSDGPADRLNRPNRGQIPFDELRQGCLDLQLVGIPADEIHAAIEDSDLSEDRSLTDDPESHQDVSMAEEDSTGDDSEAGDNSFIAASSTSATESISSDGDQDDFDWKSCLLDRGWDAERVRCWLEEQDAIRSAVDKRRRVLWDVEALESGQIDEASGERPDVMCLIDSGTFRTMIGKNARHLACNVRAIKPYPVATAGGMIWLRYAADMVINDHVLRNCLVNDHLDITLISGGWLRTIEGWKFQSDQQGLLMTDPAGVATLAYTMGVLDYLPASMVPKLEVAQLSAEFEQQCSLCVLDQTELMQMSDLEASRAWLYFSGIVALGEPSDDDMPPLEPPTTDTEDAGYSTDESTASTDSRHNMCACQGHGQPRYGGHGPVDHSLGQCTSEVAPGERYCEECTPDYYTASGGAPCECLCTPCHMPDGRAGWPTGMMDPIRSEVGDAAAMGVRSLWGQHTASSLSEFMEANRVLDCCCDSICEPAGSDTAHGSHGFACAQVYYPAREMWDKRASRALRSYGTKHAHPWNTPVPAEAVGFNGPILTPGTKIVVKTQEWTVQYPEVIEDNIYMHLRYEGLRMVVLAWHLRGAASSSEPIKLDNHRKLLHSYENRAQTVTVESRDTIQDSQIVLFGELWGVNQVERRDGSEWVCLANDRTKIRVPMIKVLEQGAPSESAEPGLPDSCGQCHVGTAAEIDQLEAWLKEAKKLMPKMSAVQIKQLGDTVGKFSKFEEKAAKAERMLHVAGGHRTKMLLNPKCLHCLMASKRPKGAFKGAAGATSSLATANIDTVDMTVLSATGHRYEHNLIIHGSQYGDNVTSRHKDSITTSKAFTEMKSRIEAFTDPGGSQGFKIQAVRHDPGSEFNGAAKSVFQAANLINCEGEVDRHSDGALIENRNRILQHMATAMSLTAFEGEHSGYEQLAVEAWDEVVKTASDLLVHSQITSHQKEMGMTAAEEQRGGRIKSADELSKFSAVGTAALLFVPKRKRDSKHSARAVRAIFVGLDRKVIGAARLMPYVVSDGSWKLLPAVVTKSYQLFEDKFPLRRVPGATVEEAFWDPSTEGRCELIAYTEVQGTPLTDVDEADESDGCAAEGAPVYEPEMVVDHHQEEGGEMVFEVKWVGFDLSETTWHADSDLPGCRGLIADYWERLAKAERVEIDSGSKCMWAALAGGGNVSAAVAEVPWAEWLSDANVEKSRAAMTIELEAMTTKVFPGNKNPRLIKLTSAELAGISDYQKRTCLKGRYACTIKRSKAHKARIVAQDLKRLNKMPAIDVHAPTPGFGAMRLMLAGSPLSEYDIHTTDFKTAYLQGFEEAWILFRLWDQSTKEWTYYWLTGPIYGQQPAGNRWKFKVETETGKMDFVESKNAPSTYYRASDGTRMSIYVDDPLIASKRDRTHGVALTKQPFYDRLKESFEFKDVTSLGGEATIDYLSMTMKAEGTDTVTLSNPEFVDKLVSNLGLDGCNSTKLPITKELLREIAAEAEAGIYVGDTEHSAYRTTVGELQWLAQTTHPDVAVAASLLSKRNSAPTPACMRALKHMGRYLSGRRHQALKYGIGDGTGLIVKSDSDLAGTYALDGETRSRIGVVVLYNGQVVHWLTKYIDTVVISSGEAEIHALSEAIKIGLHLKYVGQELGLEMPDRVPIEVDASAAIAFAENTLGVGRMKHLDLRSEWIRQMKDNQEVVFIKVDGKTNLADFFTKVLSPGEHHEYANEMTQPLVQPGGMDDSMIGAKGEE